MASLKEMKLFINQHLDYNVDFRSDAYISNQHNLCPIMNYDRAEKIVELSYDYGYKKIEEGTKAGHYKKFSGWQYNIDMTLNNLRITTIKCLCESILHDLKTYE